MKELIANRNSFNFKDEKEESQEKTNAKTSGTQDKQRSINNINDTKNETNLGVDERVGGELSGEITVKTAKKRGFNSLYTKGEEIFNAVSHIVGGALGIIAFGILFWFAFPNPQYLVSISIFSASILILYTMSSLYHFLPNGKAKAVFRIFDHCTVFLLIAGTYTPYCMIALGGTSIGILILILEWVLAAAGITMNAIAMNNKIVKAISMVLYCVMGWLIVVAFKTLFTTLSPASFWLLLMGGISYTVGIIFYALGKKVKYFHSIWHLFDLLGTALQFTSILLLLL